jgi:hypothetical protein
VVTLQGTIRGVSQKNAPKNTYGIDKYYQLAIEPEGETDQLVIAYCLELPQGFPLGDKISEHATLHGFFYKRWAYAAQDAVRTAPLIVAKSFTWKPAPPPERPEPQLRPLAVVAVAFCMFLVVALGYVLTRSWRTSPKTAEVAATQFSPETLATIAAGDEGVSTFPHADDSNSN